MLIEKLCPFIKNKKHLSDDEYFEILTGEVFQAGNGIEPVKKSWPYIRHAFANFSVDIVAHYSDSDVKRILKNKHIIRNRKKIEATIQTARVIARIKSEYGSFEAYMRSFKGDTEQFVRHLNERIYYIGASSIRNLLLCSARPTAA